MILGRQKSGPSKHCGNCYHHCVFDYPKRVFCMLRFQRRLNAVVPTLDLCENWEPDFEECFCVEEALKKSSSG